jgi:hypothetical protein
MRVYALRIYLQSIRSLRCHTRPERSRTFAAVREARLGEAAKLLLDGRSRSRAFVALNRLGRPAAMRAAAPRRFHHVFASASLKPVGGA